MLKKFFKEMPADDRALNLRIAIIAIIGGAIIAIAEYLSGISATASIITGGVIALLTCIYRFIELWIIYLDSNEGKPRCSSSNYTFSDKKDE